MKTCEKYKQELDIVKKKNAQERSALEKLVSGDIEGFIKDQQTAAATSALRSGNASLAGLFSGEARLGALRQLQEEGAGTATIQAAGRAALGIFANQRNVGILTGTDRRSEQIRAGMRQEGRFLEAVGDTQRDIGGADLAIANAALSKATEALTTAQHNATAKMESLEKTMERLNETAKRQAEAAEKAQEQVDAQNALINIVTICLGLAVGSKLSADKFLNLAQQGIDLCGTLKRDHGNIVLETNHVT